MEDMQSINVPPAGESDLFLTTFGHSVTGPGHRYGPAVRSYHLIHFILAGKGTFQPISTRIACTRDRAS